MKNTEIKPHMLIWNKDTKTTQWEQILISVNRIEKSEYKHAGECN